MIPFDLAGHEKKLKDAMDPIQKRVLKGVCTSFEEYKSLTGELKGLQSALDYVQQTLKKMIDDEI